MQLRGGAPPPAHGLPMASAVRPKRASTCVRVWARRAAPRQRPDRPSPAALPRPTCPRRPAPPHRTTPFGEGGAELMTGGVAMPIPLIKWGPENGLSHGGPFRGGGGGGGGKRGSSNFPL